VIAITVLEVRKAQHAVSSANRASQCAAQTPLDGYYSVNERLCEEGKIDPGTGGPPIASP
jgi:hypothetical protein